MLPFKKFTHQFLAFRISCSLIFTTVGFSSKHFFLIAPLCTVILTLVDKSQGVCVGWGGEWQTHVARIGKKRRSYFQHVNSGSRSIH